MDAMAFPSGPLRLQANASELLPAHVRTWRPQLLKIFAFIQFERVQLALLAKHHCHVSEPGPPW